MDMDMKMRSEKDGGKGIKGRGEICLKKKKKTSRVGWTTQSKRVGLRLHLTGLEFRLDL